MKEISNSNNINYGSGTQINGDKNYINFTKENITETEIYSLLEIVMGLDIQPEDDYSLISPTEMNEKLVYNKAFTHKDDFEDDFDRIELLASIISDFENSEFIILKLKRLFNKYAKRDLCGKKITGNGDKQLSNIEEELESLIKKDVRFNTTQEKLEQFLTSLIAYGVSKCNILINPIEKGNNSNDITR